MIKNDCIIIDDFISLQEQEEIKNVLFNPRFPWFYQRDITYSKTDTTSNTPAFSHYFIENSNIQSNAYNVVRNLAEVGSNYINHTSFNVITCRSFLQLPLSENFRNNDIDYLHVDTKSKHFVVLYYVVDSDGDTIIVDKQIERGEPIEDNLKVEDYNIIHRVTPKQGRAIIFDGSYYHTAEQPKNNVRCIINFDIN
jgi:hypothetical protein